MAGTYKARGIVLHTIKYGDSSLVAYMLTDVGGRATYMVQGLGSSGSRTSGASGRSHGNKAALLQPMFLVEFEGIETPRAEMHRLRELRAAVPLRTIPFDARKSTLALFMAELLYRLVREVEANSPLFEFVFDAVVALDTMGSESSAGSGSSTGLGVANFHLWFMVALSRHLGFAPAGEWTPGCWFDIREGIFTPVMPRGESFSRENAELLAALASASPDGAAAPPLNRTRRVDFLNAMLAYFGYHLDAVRDIRSVEILREVF